MEVWKDVTGYKGIAYSGVMGVDARDTLHPGSGQPRTWDRSHSRVAFACCIDECQAG